MPAIFAAPRSVHGYGSGRPAGAGSHRSGPVCTLRFPAADGKPMAGKFSGWTDPANPALTGPCGPHMLAA